MSKWVKAYKTEHLYRAEIVKGVLADHEVPAVVVSKKDRVYNLGHYEVHVGADDVVKAFKIITDDITFE